MNLTVLKHSISEALNRVAINKQRIQIGTTQTNVNNVSDQYLGMVDLEDSAFHDIVLEVKIVQASGSDESANDFTLYWAFCTEQISNPSANAPVQLQPVEYSLVCDLVDATAGATTRYYQSSVIQPKARYLYVWYDCDSLTNALSSVDVYLSIIT